MANQSENSTDIPTRVSRSRKSKKTFLVEHHHGFDNTQEEKQQHLQKRKKEGKETFGVRQTTAEKCKKTLLFDHYGHCTYAGEKKNRNSGQKRTVKTAKEQSYLTTMDTVSTKLEKKEKKVATADAK